MAVEGRHLGPVEEGIVAGLVPSKDIDVSHVSWKGFQCGQKSNSEMYRKLYLPSYLSRHSNQKSIKVISDVLEKLLQKACPACPLTIKKNISEV